MSYPRLGIGGAAAPPCCVGHQEASPFWAGLARGHGAGLTQTRRFQLSWASFALGRGGVCTTPPGGFELLTFPDWPLWRKPPPRPPRFLETKPFSEPVLGRLGTGTPPPASHLETRSGVWADLSLHCNVCRAGVLSAGTIVSEKSVRRQRQSPCTEVAGVGHCPLGRNWAPDQAKPGQGWTCAQVLRRHNRKAGRCGSRPGTHQFLSPPTGQAARTMVSRLDMALPSEDSHSSGQRGCYPNSWEGVSNPGGAKESGSRVAMWLGPWLGLMLLCPQLPLLGLNPHLSQLLSQGGQQRGLAQQVSFASGKCHTGPLAGGGRPGRVP